MGIRTNKVLNAGSVVEDFILVKKYRLTSGIR